MSTAALVAKGEDHGVTLIELVIAMVLLGFLAALLIPVVWYGRFGTNPVPTAQATAIAQSTLETAMTASYAQPFPNCNCTNSCNTAYSQNDYGVAVACAASALSGATAEFLTVQVNGPSGADITLGAWRTKYHFGSATAPGNGNGNGNQAGG
ncbi:MAG: type II secretion system protein [Acidithiobacillus sp.]